jgi:hypothetical protein
MRRRRVLIAVVVLALAWASAGVIYAITNGQADGDRHPYVGLLLFYVPDSNDELVPAWICSGSLIAPTVVLTAGHCTDGAAAATVWFDSDVLAGGFPDTGGFSSAPGGIQTHPGFSWAWHGLLGWDTIDTGVVVLENAVVDRGYAALPEEGLVDTLRMKTAVDIVGYGGQFKLQVSGPPGDRWVENGMRYYAPSQIVASDNRNSDMWLKLTANPGQGKGGICFGDSGGPDLLGGTNIILATNSFVANYNCAGVNYSNRVDRADVLDWLYREFPSIPR